jgi:hypothetical protein
MRQQNEAPAPGAEQPTGLLSPLHVGAAGAVRRGVERAALEVATSPATAKAARIVGGPLAARGVGAAAGAVIGGPAGAVIGNTLGDAAAPLTQRGLEAVTRGGGSFVTRLAQSALARGITGLPGMLTSMVMEPGDRPVGETPQRTAGRQAEFAREYQRNVNAKAGRQVIRGNSVDEILASIAKYRGSK